MNTKTIGIGQLNWNRHERVSDRYGAVGLYNDAHWQTGDNESKLLALGVLAGAVGTLSATVLETRDADHIGDLFHGWGPGGAEVGATYVLGHGVLFHEFDCGDKIGVRPLDGREILWLDGRALYTCHSQTVRLEFTPDPTAAPAAN
jgi:hypothetical protein